MKSTFRRRALRLAAFTLLADGTASLFLSPARAQNPLVTGKNITLPPIGTLQNVGSLPMNLILSPNGKFAVSTDMGFRESLWSLNTITGGGASELKFDNSIYNPKNSSTYGLYYGLAFNPTLNPADNTYTLYAGQGGNNTIAIVKMDADTGLLTKTGELTGKTASFFGIPVIDFPSGVALDGRGYLYVANNDPGVPAVGCSVAVYNTATNTETGRYTFPPAKFGPPNFPLAIAALANGSKIFVGSQRDGAVYVLSANIPGFATPAAPQLIGSIPTGAHPVGLLLNKAQTLLYVANAHSDTVSVVNTATNAVVRTILLRPSGARGLAGVSPNNLALSPDEKTLYVSLGDMNAVGVIDTARYQLKGYIPVGWYPTGVVVSPSNTRLLVSNAKGTKTRYPNPQFKTQINPPPADFNQAQYDLNQIEGNVQTLAVPNDAALASYTKLTVANNRITPLTDNPVSNPLAGVSLTAGKIKHVLYIIKENRTFDQVLGDIGVPGVNADPSLTLFGNDVTPNLHALAKRFAIFDNFYDCGEASGDGWPWSTQSFATEYVIKNLPYNYSGRGRQYDFEGQNNGYPVGGFPAFDLNGNLNSVLFPSGGPAIPDVSEAPAHHIWDIAQAAGRSFRNYGFFYSFGVAIPGVGSVIPDNHPGAVGLLPTGRDLAGKSDYDFRRFDTAFADSDAPTIYAAQTGDPTCLFPTPTYGKYKQPSRYSEWKREFDQFLAKDATGGAVPAFETVRFMSDHTQGFDGGFHSPRSMVADNDYAVGQLVEAVSKSPIWDSTAIFVIEDDAQDGPDHVDAHRSTCYVISPYLDKGTAAQPFVDHTFYNTDSVLHTMELLLGLPAMSQYDAIATPFTLAFGTAPTNNAPYTAILPAKEIICERNPKIAALNAGDPRRRLAIESAKMDFVHPDSAPSRLLNELLWAGIKGFDKPMPEPRHSVAFAGLARKANKAASKTATAKLASSRDADDDD